MRHLKIDLECSDDDREMVRRKLARHTPECQIAALLRKRGRQITTRDVRQWARQNRSGDGTEFLYLDTLWAFQEWCENRGQPFKPAIVEAMKSHMASARRRDD